MDSTSTSTAGSRQHLASNTDEHENARHDHRKQAKGRTAARQPIPSDTHFSNGGDLAYRHEVTGAARKKNRKNTSPNYRKQEQADGRHRIPSHAHISNGGDLALQYEVMLRKPACSLL